MANSVADIWRRASEDSLTFLLTFFGLVVYAAISTDFTFNFFGIEGYWQGYNYYALSLLEGRFDVPAEAIGYEGWFYKGKVYVSYGILPALARLPLSFLIDLETVPVARLFVYLCCAASATILQVFLFRLYRQQQNPSVSARQWYLLISVIVWFNSGLFLIVQNANIFHEPYAFSLLFTSVFLVAYGNHYILGTTSFRRMIFLCAVCAGLTLLARPTFAIGLYAATCFLIFYRFVSFRPAGVRVERFKAREFLSGAMLPLFTLFTLGFFYLATNYGKYGTLSPSLPTEHYGYFLFLEGYSERLVAFIEHGTFSLRRILPNLLAYLFNDHPWHQPLVKAMGLGLIRIEVPGPSWVLLLLVPVYLAFKYFQHLVRNWKKEDHLFQIGLLALLFIPAFLILCYGTVSARYTSEFWPFLFLALIYYFREQIRASGAGARGKRNVDARLVSFALVGAIIYGAIFSTGYSKFWQYNRNPSEQMQIERERGAWPLTTESPVFRARKIPASEGK